MPAVVGYTDAIGTFIDAWDDGLVEAYKNVVPILADAKFGEAQMVGGVYHVATRLTYEGGQTLAAARTQPGDNGLAYVGPRAGQSPDAQVEGMQIHGRSRVTYEALARSMQSVDATSPNKKKAVQAATKLVGDGLMQGTLKKAETLMLHGREGLGQLDSAVNPSNVVATNYTDGTIVTAGFAIDVSISPATWAEAIWAAFEGHTFDLFLDASGLPTGNKLNTATNTLLTGGANQTGLVLIAINPSTPLTNGPAFSPFGRVLRLWHSSGTAGAIGTGVIGGYTTLGSGLNTQHLCFESGGPTSEFVGLGLMAQNQGTLFNINSQTFGMYRGNLITSVGNLRLASLIRYLKTPINHGAQGTTIRAVVPTELFSQFANDEATLRRYSSITGDAENGFSSIEMYLPHKSKLEILGHALQKDGIVTAYVPTETMRVGSQDIDFVNRSGGRSRKDQLLVEVQDRPASEMRLFGQFAPIVETPRHMLKLTGVTF
jgi:hypothetical protein